MAKTRINSAKSRQSSGEVQADDAATSQRDPLQVALEVTGRKPYPLEPAGFLQHEIVLQCRAVVARAGLNASNDELAQVASKVLREIITKIRDDVDRRIAEAAFAANSNYEGKQVGERQEFLFERHGITKDMYADRRPLVFARVAHELRTYVAARASGVVFLHPSQVAATATRLYYASVATRVLIEDRLRLLGDDALALHEPNLPLYSAHLTFLLTAHRYLHTIDPIEDVAKPELMDIFRRVIANGPLRDIVYLAHIYGGRDRLAYFPDDSNSEADRLIRITWTQWYERQESSGSVDGTELHLLSLTVLEFRNALPRIGELNFYTDHYHPQELEPALKAVSVILHNAITYKGPVQAGDQPPSSRVLSDVIDTEYARDQWVDQMADTVKMRARWEPRKAKAAKPWDDLIAMRLHSKG